MLGPAYPNRLKAWREFRGFSQERLAEQAGCSKATIGHLESGARRLSDKWLAILSPILNAPPGYLLEHDPENLPTDILDVWAAIPEERRAQALRVLEAFKTGTNG